jgi:hypothetical protein
MSTCPAVDTADGYTLRCILPAEHEGDHLADTIEEAP